MNRFELGRLDGWYRRGHRFPDDPDYEAGFAAGEKHYYEKRAWTRAHEAQSYRLDHGE